MGMKILVLHGPNLNLLGEREGDERGRTLDDLNGLIRAKAGELGLEVKIFQSNHEGVLVDTLHAERRWADAILINPAALTHTSYVLRDAVAAVKKPTLEVHLTDIRRRESWRRKSVIKDVCDAQVMGKGFDSYLIALQRFADKDLSGRKRRGKAEVAVAPKAALAPKTKVREEPRAPAPPKTIGRRAAEEPPARQAPQKTLGPAPAKDREPLPAPRAPAAMEKTVGRRTGDGAKGKPGAEGLSRAVVRQKIADRLAGKLSPAGLATWARSQWLEVQRGAPAESGQRELLEDSLQSLVLSALPASRLSDEQLVDLMAQLEG
jgi:3-dehydroquinate dehydratase II